METYYPISKHVIVSAICASALREYGTDLVKVNLGFGYFDARVIQSIGKNNPQPVPMRLNRVGNTSTIEKVSCVDETSAGNIIERLLNNKKTSEHLNSILTIAASSLIEHTCFLIKKRGGNEWPVRTYEEEITSPPFNYPLLPTYEMINDEKVLIWSLITPSKMPAYIKTK